MASFFRRVWFLRSRPVANATSWGIIGLCGGSFAYTYSAQKTLSSPESSYDDRVAANSRWLWCRDNLFVSRRNLDEGRWWTPLTSIFCHGSPEHIILNMVTFYVYARFTVERICLGNFGLLYLGGGVFSSLIATMDKKAYDTPGLGASGAVTALLAFTAWISPRSRVLLMLAVPMPLWLYCVAFGAVSVAFQASGTAQGIGHLAHLGGLVYGPTFALILRHSRLINPYASAKAIKSRASKPGSHRPKQEPGRSRRQFHTMSTMRPASRSQRYPKLRPSTFKVTVGGWRH